MRTNELENLQTEIKLLPKAQKTLQEITKWTKISAVIGLIIIGVLSLSTIFILLLLKGNIFRGFLSAIILILVAFSFYFLMKFSKETSLALKEKKDFLLTRGFENLKISAKLMGIFLILFGLYLLAVIGIFLYEYVISDLFYSVNDIDVERVLQ